MSREVARYTLVSFEGHPLNGIVVNFDVGYRPQVGDILPIQLPDKTKWRAEVLQVRFPIAVYETNDKRKVGQAYTAELQINGQEAR